MDQELMIDDDMEPDPQLNEVTNAVLGACFEVHSALGPGYQEQIYANALAIEFRKRNIRFEREVLFKVMYKNEQVGEGRADFIVEGCVLVELKTVETLHPLFTAQCISYLKATRIKLALLMNFNVRKLKEGIKRIAL
jgi:GxxExxY protein